MEEKQNTNAASSSALATAPIGRLMLKLSVPMVLAQVVNLLYNVVDRIYIGHIPKIGQLALTGVGICFPVITLIAAFYMLIAQGSASLASIEMGRGDNDKAERYLGGCFMLLVITALVLTAVFELCGEQLLWMFGASEATIGYALPYLRIYVGGSLFVMLAMGLNLYVTAQGFTSYSMRAVLIGAVSNIVLDPIFIFVFQWGVVGAAIATILSQALSAAFVLSFLTGKKTILHLRRERMRVDWAQMKQALLLGLAPFIMQATEAFLNVAFNSSLQEYGGDIAVGAMTVASTVMMMLGLPANGIGQGAQPIISYNYGARDAVRVRKAVRLMFAVLSGYIFLFWALVELFPQAVIRIFNDDPSLLDTATWALRLYLAGMGAFGLQSSSQQVFMATGKARQSLFVAILRKVILLIPLIYILPNFFDDKVFAVFLAEPVADVISITCCTALFLVTFRRDMAKLAQEEAGRDA